MPILNVLVGDICVAILQWPVCVGSDLGSREQLRVLDGKGR